MKTISDYSIYCTESQTRKALELGAPILKFHNALMRKDVPHFYVGKVCSQSWDVYVQPTAEQLIGWLEEQESISDIDIYKFGTDWWFEIFPTVDNYIKDNGFETRKEATLAAIDAALEYLSKNK